MGLGEGIQTRVRSFYAAWGHFVGRKPKTTICMSIGLAFLLCLRLFLIPAVGPLPEEVRQEYLFAPQDSLGFKDMQRYDSTWGEGYRRNVIYFTTQPKGGNVLTSAVLTEIRRFAALVENNVTTSGGLGKTFEQSYGRRDLCAPPGARPSCTFINYALELFYMSDSDSYNFDFTDAQIAAIVSSGVGIDPALFPPGSNRTLETESLLGGLGYDDAGTLVSAQAIALYYFNEGVEDDSHEETITEMWEEQVNYLVGPEWTNSPPDTEGSVTDGLVEWSSSLVDVYPSTTGAISRELRKNIQGDITLFMVGIYVLISYTVFVMVSPRNCLTSRGTLLIAGLVSTGLAIAISFGLATLFVKNNVVVSVLPFVLIGIGVDDMFVLVHALSETAPDLPVPERMALAMGHAGASITVTSLTDVIAFALGTTSVLPGLSSFCVFAVFGIAADFLMQITFFAGFMALDAHREQRPRHDCFCCNPCGASCPSCCKRYSTLQEINKRFYVPLLRKRPVKAVILLFFLAFTCTMAWCASNLKQDFDREWFVNTDAKLTDAFDIRDDYFSDGRGVPVQVTTPTSENFDYTSIVGQGKLTSLRAAVDNNRWIIDGSTEDWYTPLRAWLHKCVPPVMTAAVPAHCNSTTGASKYMVRADGATACEVGAAQADCYVPPTLFYEHLAEYVSTEPYGRSLATNLRWVAGCASAYNNGASPSPSNCAATELALGLEATKIGAIYVQASDSTESVKTMRELRDDVYAVEMGSEINGEEATYPYSYAYVFYEQYAIIVREAMTNLSLAAAATFLLVLLTVSDVRAALYVLLCVVMVDVDILGLMWLWGLTIDSVTIINLVLAIGLVVDYSAHIAHAFVITPGSRQERADHAIGSMGSAVFHGAMSTFAAVVVLGGSTSYIYRVFFVQFFGICVFGMAHGLIFLPVLLSLVGPPAIDVGVEASASMQKPQSVPVAARNKNPEVAMTPDCTAAVQTA